MAQEELRRRAVALVGEGRSQTEVAALLDVSRQSVSEWVRANRLGGAEVGQGVRIRFRFRLLGRGAGLGGR